jgi:hypothetical protein
MAALITGGVFGLLGFLIISSNVQYTTTSLKLSNGVGAALVFGGMGFGIVWLLTVVTRLTLTYVYKLRARRAQSISRTASSISVTTESGPGVHRASRAASAHTFARQPNRQAWTHRGNGIFISYRRHDEPNFAGRLYDKLALDFGEDSVFMDVDSIELGLDFEEAISDSLSQCRVLIAVIGRNWLGATDAQGRRRLDQPNDYVRREIEVALSREIRVIPILVEGASVPNSADLPKSIAALSRRNGLVMTYTRFKPDTDQLIATLRRILAANQPPRT